MAFSAIHSRSAHESNYGYHHPKAGLLTLTTTYNFLPSFLASSVPFTCLHIFILPRSRTFFLDAYHISPPFFHNSFFNSFLDCVIIYSFPSLIPALPLFLISFIYCVLLRSITISSLPSSLYRVVMSPSLPLVPVFHLLV